MTLLDSPFGLFAFWGSTGGILAVLTIYLRKHESVAVVPVGDQVSFVLMESTSPVIMALEPMGESNTDYNKEHTKLGEPKQPF